MPAKSKLIALLFISMLVSPGTVSALELNIPTSWDDAKDTMDDEVYMDHRITLYCGCYVSKNNNRGSGSMTAEGCGITEQSEAQHSSERIEWEHIVPASHMPARKFSCWTKKNQFDKCNNLGGRKCCQKISFTAQSMIFDLHNLAPAFGQINQYRFDGKYGIVEHPDYTWENCDIRDTGANGQGASHLFEPADCTKGDVARVWLYMHVRHGLVISDEDLEMFKQWSELDPVSSWEKTRHDRIAAIQGNVNPFVDGEEASEAGSCPWEQ